MSPRIVFMGSPLFALPTLQILAKNYSVVGVITQPDQPAGRGRNLISPPIKLLADELCLPVIQPLRLRHPEAIEQLRQWKPDIVVVAAYGQILRADVLDLPELGCINVHASLLPRWRGAAPIQAAILHGDIETGITIMQMDTGIDTGPILSQTSLAIRPEDTAESLSGRLAKSGADLLINTLPGYLNGRIQPQPQNELMATYAPMLKKEDGLLNTSLPAVQLERQVRAYNPWPGAYTMWEGNILKIHHATAASGGTGEGVTSASIQTIYKGVPALRTAQGLLVLDEVQPAGKRAMNGKAFIQGAKTWGIT